MRLDWDDWDWPGAKGLLALWAVASVCAISIALMFREMLAILLS